MDQNFKQKPQKFRTPPTTLWSKLLDKFYIFWEANGTWITYTGFSIIGLGATAGLGFGVYKVVDEAKKRSRRNAEKQNQEHHEQQEQDMNNSESAMNEKHEETEKVVNKRYTLEWHPEVAAGDPNWMIIGWTTYNKMTQVFTKNDKQKPNAQLFPYNDGKYSLTFNDINDVGTVWFRLFLDGQNGESYNSNSEEVGKYFPTKTGMHTLVIEDPLTKKKLGTLKITVTTA